MNIFNNHIRLYITAGLLFALLTYFTVVMPAFQNQYANMPLPGTKPLSGDAKAGKLLYIAEGCVGCIHNKSEMLKWTKCLAPVLEWLLIMPTLVEPAFGKTPQH